LNYQAVLNDTYAIIKPSMFLTIFYLLQNYKIFQALAFI